MNFHHKVGGFCSSVRDCQSALPTVISDHAVNVHEESILWVGGGRLENRQPVAVRHPVMNANGEKSSSLRERRAVWLFVFGGDDEEEEGEAGRYCLCGGWLYWWSINPTVAVFPCWWEKIKRFHFNAETLLKQLLNFSSVLVLLDLLEQATPSFTEVRGQRPPPFSLSSAPF